MKFMINGKMSHLNLDIHGSTEVVVVAHFAMVSRTYLSVIFLGIANKCSFINCFRGGKQTYHNAKPKVIERVLYNR